MIQRVTFLGSGNSATRPLKPYPAKVSFRNLALQSLKSNLVCLRAPIYFFVSVKLWFYGKGLRIIYCLQRNYIPGSG